MALVGSVETGKVKLPRKPQQPVVSTPNRGESEKDDFEFESSGS
jgi:hypothetical protein